MRWQQSDVRLPKISVNLSARQFSTGQLDQRVAQTISASGIAAAALELELTESILMVDIEQLARQLQRVSRCPATIDQCSTQLRGTPGQFTQVWPGPIRGEQDHTTILGHQQHRIALR